MPFIYKKWNIIFFHKMFDKIWPSKYKSDHFMTSKHRHVWCLSRGKMWECWRCVLRYYLGWAYLEKNPPMYLHLALLLEGPNLGLFRAFSTDTLTQIRIWAQSANIPASRLWIDTPYEYDWTPWNCLFLMGGPNFEGRIHPANSQKCFEKYTGFSQS